MAGEDWTDEDEAEYQAIQARMARRRAESLVAQQPAVAPAPVSRDKLAAPLAAPSATPAPIRRHPTGFALFPDTPEELAAIQAEDRAMGLPPALEPVVQAPVAHPVMVQAPVPALRAPYQQVLATPARPSVDVPLSEGDLYGSKMSGIQGVGAEAGYWLKRGLSGAESIKRRAVAMGGELLGMPGRIAGELSVIASPPPIAEPGPAMERRVPRGGSDQFGSVMTAAPIPVDSPAREAAHAAAAELAMLGGLMTPAAPIIAGGMTLHGLKGATEGELSVDRDAALADIGMGALAGVHAPVQIQPPPPGVLPVPEAWGGRAATPRPMIAVDARGPGLQGFRGAGDVGISTGQRPVWLKPRRSSGPSRVAPVVGETAARAQEAARDVEHSAQVKLNRQRLEAPEAPYRETERLAAERPAREAEADAQRQRAELEEAKLKGSTADGGPVAAPGDSKAGPLGEVQGTLPLEDGDAAAGDGVGGLKPISDLQVPELERELRDTENVIKNTSSQVTRRVLERTVADLRTELERRQASTAAREPTTTAVERARLERRSAEERARYDTAEELPEPPTAPPSGKVKPLFRRAPARPGQPEQTPAQRLEAARMYQQGLRLGRAFAEDPSAIEYPELAHPELRRGFDHGMVQPLTRVPFWLRPLRKIPVGR